MNGADFLAAFPVTVAIVGAVGIPVAAYLYKKLDSNQRTLFEQLADVRLKIKDETIARLEATIKMLERK